MTLDLFVDTSRKGISMGLSDSTSGIYQETVDASARGETASAILDELLTRVGATLDDVKRVMVTVGPGSFSGLRTGVAFCQGICFSGKRNLYGVSTLQALECFAPKEKQDNIAVLIKARNGYWYLRQDAQESFISTEDALAKLNDNEPSAMVIDDAALADESFALFIREKGVLTINEKNQPLSAWAPLFDSIPASLIQEANYIQPSYFEKLQK